jgi:hypothetical protein
VVKLILSFILANIVVRIGRRIKMSLTGASMEIVSSRAHWAWVLVIAFLIYSMMGT